MVSGLVEALTTINSDYLSPAGKYMLTLATKRAASGNLTANDFKILCRAYTDLKREENRYLTLETAVTTSSPDASWDASIINDQNIYSDLPGTFGSYGTLKKNGCGYIAIHNVKQIMGDHTKFIDTYFELNSLSDSTRNLCGILGMNTSMISEYLGQQGYRVTAYSDYDNVPLNHDAYIVAYIYFWGAHYIAAQYDPSTKKLIAYNDDGRQEYSTFDELFSKDKAQPICIWTIDNPSNTGDGNSIPHMQEK